MALDHPYHTLYSLIALRNGNLGRNGQPVPTGAAAGAQVLARQEFDMDKVRRGGAGHWAGDALVCNRSLVGRQPSVGLFGRCVKANGVPAPWRARLSRLLVPIIRL
jgi:hypothetical protein